MRRVFAFLNTRLKRAALEMQEYLYLTGATLRGILTFAEA